MATVRFESTPVAFGAANGPECVAFELDPQRLELRRYGRPVDVRPQAVQALALLLRHAGRLVTMEELRLALWGDQELAWRNSLHRCIRDLRRALDDDARDPRFVETVTRLGYRFVGRRADAARRMPQASMPRSSWIRRAFRHRVFAFVTGFATALLLPAAILLWCALFPS